MTDPDGTRAAWTSQQLMTLGFCVAIAALAAIGFGYNAGTRAHPATGAAPAPTPRPSSVAFTPPAESTIPDGPEGDAIRRGEAIFLHTRAHAGNYVGNGLSCDNCHLDGGRTAGAAPMWAAWVSYPAYRAKNGEINTMERRILECFRYSMNAPASPSGGPPPPGNPIYADLEIYFYWLATGLPTGQPPAGRGYPELAATTQGHDPARGATVFASQCASCHGADGQGAKNSDGSYAYPPLWGANSFNWGAGMGKIANAAAFIKANMPFGQGGTLTDQQAWDVAAFVDSHDRPRDPRQTGTIAAAKAQFHKKGDYYGQTVNGDLLGDGITTARPAP